MYGILKSDISYIHEKSLEFCISVELSHLCIDKCSQLINSQSRNPFDRARNPVRPERFSSLLLTTNQLSELHALAQTCSYV